MDAAEQRRQKILRNSNRRMELLLGMKQHQPMGSDQQQQLPVIKQPFLVQTSTNKDTSSTSSFNENEMISALSEQPKVTTTNSVPVQRKKGSILFTKPSDAADLSTGQIRINGSDTAALSGHCRFNGYSNNEIIIMFLLAFLTCMLFFFDQSYYIGQVGSLFSEKLRLIGCFYLFKLFKFCYRVPFCPLLHLSLRIFLFILIACQ